MAVDVESPRTRRAVLAGALGGFAAWVASAAGVPRPAAAANGQPVLLGLPNSATKATVVANSGTSHTESDNALQGSAAAGYGVLGVSSSGTAVGAEAQGAGGLGVWARSQGGGTAVLAWSQAPGEMGITIPSKTAVYGRAAHDSTAIGVRGESTIGVGVAGVVTTGQAVRGVSTKGLDLVAGGSGRVLLVPSANGGPPTSGTYSRGEMIRDSAGAMWLCVSTGTPGTWRRVVTVASGTLGGALTLLPSPARVFDSRASTGVINAGTVLTLSVANAIASAGGGMAVPPGALGIAYNLTITGTVRSGWLALIPRLATFRGTSSINWSASGQTIANGGVVGLGGDRQIEVRCGPSLAATHFILDIAGYYM